MIAYYMILRIKLFFLRRKKFWIIVTHLIFLIIAYLYGRFFAELVNKASYGELFNIPPETLFNFVFLFIGSITLIRMLIPTYKPLIQVLPSYYPLSKWQLYLLSIIADFQKPYFFYMILFIICGFFNLDYLKWNFLLYALCILLSAHLIRRLIQYLVDFKVDTYSYYYFTISISLLAIITLNINFSHQFLQYASLLLPIVLFSIGYFMQCQVIEKKNFGAKKSSDKGNLIFKLLFNNRNARLPLIVALLLKFSILITDLLLFKLAGKHIFDVQLIYFIIASPLIIFTYIFNNTWAYWINIWLNYELRSGKPIDLYKFNLSLLCYPVIFDAIITVPTLLYCGYDFQFLLLFYFISLIFLICTSFVWSLLFPIYIKSTFQMKGSSSFISTFVSFLAVIILALIKVDLWFYLLIPLYLIVSFMACKLVLDLYKYKKYILFKKIFTF